jgi:hypothetical protein
MMLPSATIYEIISGNASYNTPDIAPHQSLLTPPRTTYMVPTTSSDIRALASLNLASNNLGAEAAKIIAAVLPKCT